MNPVYALVNACNIMDLLYGSIYALRLLGKGIGPYGNGSWNRRKGGYNKLKDAVTDVQMKRAQTFRGRHSREDVDEFAQEESEAFKYEPMRVNQEFDMAGGRQPSPSPPGYDAPYAPNPYDTSYHGSVGMEQDRDRLLARSHSPS